MELACGTGLGWRCGEGGEPGHTDKPLPRQVLSPSKKNPTLETTAPDSGSHPYDGVESMAMGHLRRWGKKCRDKTDKFRCFFLTISFLIIFFPLTSVTCVHTRQTWPTLIPADFCGLCKCLRERWDSQEVSKRAGCQGLRNGRNAHMFSVCDTATDGNHLIAQRDWFTIPLHQSLRCFPYLWLSLVC